ncbi:hypothetical protein DB32_005291 [Sandaracinus amylolyticus]|uniref:Uncharacterized protein n=1 Tax=Sandaracinus amylolyticus TaxID=927083 RepID=A0A0F6W5S4_9BACT|nr:hypothetical protein DB32_005291 [Sandaracinus amylolyticus]
MITARSERWCIARLAESRIVWLHRDPRHGPDGRTHHADQPANDAAIPVGSA